MPPEDCRIPPAPGLAKTPSVSPASRLQTNGWRGYQWSERELQRELQLPRVEHGPGLAKVLVREERNEQRRTDWRGCQSSAGSRWESDATIGAGRRGVATLNRASDAVIIVTRDRCRRPTENRRTIDGGDLIHIRAVEDVE